MCFPKLCMWNYAQNPLVIGEIETKPMSYHYRPTAPAVLDNVATGTILGWKYRVQPFHKPSFVTKLHVYLPKEIPIPSWSAILDMK